MSSWSVISLKDVVYAVARAVQTSWAGQLSQSQCEEGEGGQRTLTQEPGQTWRVGP